MAVRRLNYTGRKRIRRAHARFYIRETDDGSPAYDADLLLGSYDLPPEALVFVEGYRQTSWMRFHFGTVGNMTAPRDRRLTQFDSAEAVLFRVRVTSNAEPLGLLLAEADRIRPRRMEEKEETRIPLFPAKPDDDLGDQMFRVDFTDHPLLLVNARLANWRAVARNPVFVSLAYPAALQEILMRILRIEDHFDVVDASDWKSQWLHYATLLPGVPDPPQDGDSDRIDDWINEAVAAFCRRYSMMGRFRRYWTVEGQS